jgi:glycine/D-amino acid oxidase-like deaminating enzyme
MGMGEVPIDDLRAPFQEEMVEKIIDAAVHRVPILEHARLQTGWTGVRPLTPDGHAIVGEVDGIEGLVLNCGWGGEGLIMAPVAGQLAAEFVVDGHTTTVDTSGITLGRFEDQAH